MGGAQPLRAASVIPPNLLGTGGAVTTSNGLGAVSGGFGPYGGGFGPYGGGFGAFGGGFGGAGFAYNPGYATNNFFGGYGTNAWSGYSTYGGVGYGGMGYGMGVPQYGGYNAGMGFTGSTFPGMPVSNGGTVGAARGNAGVAAMMNGVMPPAPRNSGRANSRVKSTKRRKR